MQFHTLKYLAKKSTQLGSSSYFSRLTISLFFFFLAVVFLAMSIFAHWAALDAAVLFLVLAGWGFQSAGYELRLQAAELDSDRY